MLINVKINISLKRGVYMPDSTYKTAKIMHQKYSHRAEVDCCCVEGKENSMAYIGLPAFDQRMHRSNEWVSQKQLTSRAW